MEYAIRRLPMYIVQSMAYLFCSTCGIPPQVQGKANQNSRIGWYI